MQWQDDTVLPVDETAMQPVLLPAAQPGRHHDSVRYGAARRAALLCVLALASTGIWAALLGLCSWLLDIPTRPVVRVGILLVIFLFQLLALGLIAGASGGPDLNRAGASRRGPHSRRRGLPLWVRPSGNTWG